MGKRRPEEEEGIRLIAAGIMLLVIVWVFLPGIRVWLVAGVSLAAVAGIAWLILTLARSGRRSRAFPPMWLGPQSAQKSDDVTTNRLPPPPVTDSRESVLAGLRRLDWFQFEKLVAAIYRSYGDSVERLGGAHPDGGVDLIVTAKTGRFVVQCKHWCNWTVGVKNIRELLGTLTTSGIPKGVFVTMRGYSEEARDLGVKHGLVLLDEKQLAELIVGLGPAHGAEVLALLNDPRKFCPKCEREMVLRTARRGSNAGRQFWGCPNYPRCDGTIDA